MRRTLVPALGASLAALAVFSPLARPQTPPQLVVFLSDDQAVDAVAGSPSWSNLLDCHTPNLAALAAQGVVFSNARVNPWCSPTRAGLMCGRHALWSGVSHLVNSGAVRKEAELYGLRGREWTVAEMLRAAGYYTILVDKWHLGSSELLGQDPLSQGFEVFHSAYDHLPLDDPEEIGDEHVSRMVDLALDAVLERPDPSQPYALFYTSIDPHFRSPDSLGLQWWRVDPALAPLTAAENPPENDLHRYRAVVEAQDTEMARLLSGLGVVDDELGYVEESDTLFFFLADNGTPRLVAPDPDRAKGSLFEGGLRVPCLVFGEGLSTAGVEDPRPVSHVDLFETLADVAGATPGQRGKALRHSMSFADAIGWAPPGSLPVRRYTLSSIATEPTLVHAVALADERFKLIAPGGGHGLAALDGDRFFDLAIDPGEEDDLVQSGMSAEQLAAYFDMREALVDHWSTAVSQPFVGPDLALVDLPGADFAVLAEGPAGPHAFEGPLTVGHRSLGALGEIEQRAFVQFDLTGLEGLLPAGFTLQDLESAQLVLPFLSDARGAEDIDTGPIRAHPVTLAWSGIPDALPDLFDAFEPLALGVFDPAPYIRWEAGGHPGLPMDPGTPVSFGHSDVLRERVLAWHADPESNHGVAFEAEQHEGSLGDQQVSFLHAALLRLTLRK